MKERIEKMAQVLYKTLLKSMSQSIVSENIKVYCFFLTLYNSVQKSESLDLHANAFPKAFDDLVDFVLGDAGDTAPGVVRVDAGEFADFMKGSREMLSSELRQVLAGEIFPGHLADAATVRELVKNKTRVPTAVCFTLTIEMNVATHSFEFYRSWEKVSHNSTNDTYEVTGVHAES